MTYARVLVFQEGNQWIAQCLDFDICAHAKDEATLLSRFSAVFSFERNLSIERKGNPFAGLDPAPEEYHEMWRDGGPAKRVVILLQGEVI